MAVSAVGAADWWSIDSLVGFLHMSSGDMYHFSTRFFNVFVVSTPDGMDFAILSAIAVAAIFSAIAVPLFFAVFFTDVINFFFFLECGACVDRHSDELLRQLRLAVV